MRHLTQICPNRIPGLHSLGLGQRGLGLRQRGPGLGQRSPGLRQRGLGLRQLSLCLIIGVALGATFPVWGQEKISTFFVGRLAFGDNHGGDCGDVGEDLVRLVAGASTLEVQEERLLDLSDEGLFETPFLFMNGHHDFELSETELEHLRLYFERGGFVFASGCCTNPDFPAAWRRELGRVLPGETVRAIPYDHLIYRSFYQMERLRSLNGDRDIQLEGLFVDGELVAVIGEDGLCCAFAMDGSCNLGRGVVPEDAKKIALNIAVYSLTH